MAMNLNCRPVTKVLPEKQDHEIIACPIAFKRLDITSVPIGVLCIDKEKYSIEIIAEGGEPFGQYYKRVVDGETIVASRDGWEFHNHVVIGSNIYPSGLLYSISNSGVLKYYDLDRQKTYIFEGGSPLNSYNIDNYISLGVANGTKKYYCSNSGESWFCYDSGLYVSDVWPVGYSSAKSFVVVERSDSNDPLYANQIFFLPESPGQTLVPVVKPKLSIHPYKVIPFKDCFLVALVPRINYMGYVYFILLDIDLQPFPKMKYLTFLDPFLKAYYCGDGLVLVVVKGWNGYYYLVPLDFTDDQSGTVDNVSLSTEPLYYQTGQKLLNTTPATVNEGPLGLTPKYAPFTIQTTC